MFKRSKSGSQIFLIPLLIFTCFIVGSCGGGSNAKRTFSGHTERVDAVAFSPDGTKIASGGNDGKLIIWDVSSGRVLHDIQADRFSVDFVTFSPDGGHVLGGCGRKMKLYGTETGQLDRTFEAESIVKDAAFTPDGNTIFGGMINNNLGVWDAARGTNMGTLTGHTSNVSSVDISPDGKYGLSSSMDETIILWDMYSWTVVRTMNTEASGHARFSPDGKSIVSGGSSGDLVIWDVDTGADQRIFRGEWVQSHEVDFTPDGNYVLTAEGGSSFGMGPSYDLRVWDLSTGKVAQSYKGHDDPLGGGFAMTWGLDISPDGNYAVTSATDGKILLWELGL